MDEKNINSFKNKNIYEAFNKAISGIIYSFKSGRNMKIQFAIAIIVLIVTLFLKIEKVEFLILMLTISIVLITELINTAIEKSIDAYCDIYQPNAKIAKDVAAGAVVISCVTSVLVGFFIFKDKLFVISENVLDRVLDEKSYLAITAILLTMILVIVLKAIFNKGTPLEGGMPSGHVAISFAILTLIAIFTKNILIIVLTAILVFMIAQSRYQNKIHTFGEILFGAFWGTLIVLIIYYLIMVKGSVM